MIKKISTIILFILLVGCGADSSEYIPEYGPLQVTIVNQSEFDIKRVYLHTQIDNYKKNVIQCNSTIFQNSLLECFNDNHITYSADYSVEIDGMRYFDKPYNKKTFCFNNYKLKYVTFVRQIATTVENEIAITTEIPLDLIDGLVELNIFAEDFFYTRAINSSKICQDIW